ncbi:MAG: hypothetical protein HY319_05200 [Armatimonadetes bacterium]|nr:hypothetical protein [Armatimonadota bacterium]
MKRSYRADLACLVLVLALLALAASWPPPQELPGLLVDGLRLGMSRREVRLRLGEAAPSQRVPEFLREGQPLIYPASRPAYRYPSLGTGASFDDGRVVRILGRSVRRDGHLLFQEGDPESRVVEVLHEPMGWMGDDPAFKGCHYDTEEPLVVLYHHGLVAAIYCSSSDLDDRWFDELKPRCCQGRGVAACPWWHSIQARRRGQEQCP